MKKCPLKDYGYEKEAIRTIGLQLLHENRSYDLTLFLADLQTYGWDKALHGYKKRKNEIWDAYTYISPLTYLWIAIISISEVVYFLLMLKVCASGFQVLVISSLAVLYVNHSRLSLVLSDNDKLLQQMHFYLEEYRLGQKTRREAFKESHRQDKRKRFQADADILRGIVLQLIAVLAIIGTVSHLHLW